MQLFAIARPPKKPRHRASCRTAFYVPCKIELATVAGAFEKPSGGIPFWAASQVRAAVIECHHGFSIVAFQDPSPSLRHV
jgi:hypothetical protein